MMLLWTPCCMATAVSFFGPYDVTQGVSIQNYYIFTYPLFGLPT